ncbi:hypothetical protein PQR53_34585 [Paraburkholderia fungorum]|uniref:hypothetical protein n=1 Tax=Paraburkholderia fungorum TaxID=134537 RepID=UPI0038BA937B
MWGTLTGIATVGANHAVDHRSKAGRWGVNIVAGRATLTDGPQKLYAYVHKELTSAAARLDQFLSRNGVASDERVTVINDDAGEFDKAVQGSQLARGRILDWLHIAMKFHGAQRTVFGSKMIAALKRESVETEINHATWLVWHGRAARRWSGSRHWTVGC